MRHSLEQAQIRFRQKETWFKKPEGSPQKEVSNQGLEA